MQASEMLSFDGHDDVVYFSIKDTLMLIVENDSYRQNITQPDLNSLALERLNLDTTNSRLTILVNIYFDEFEIANPIGSYRGVHKVGGFYFNIKNLDSKFKSKLTSIHTFALGKRSVLNPSGVDFILSKAVDEFKSLICCTLKDHKVSVRLFSVIGDMPASSLLCGFKQSASANLPCRICLIERKDLSVTTLQNIKQRDYDAHKIQVTEVAQCSATSKICGINRASVLSNLSYFDIMILCMLFWKVLCLTL